MISVASSAVGCGRQAEADMDCRQKPVFEFLVVEPDGGLERADEIADHIFGRIVQQRHQPGLARQPRLELGRQPLDQHAMLGHGEGVIASGLPVPARDTRQTVGDVLDLDIQRRGIEQVEPASAQHALPGARLVLGGGGFAGGHGLADSGFGVARLP